MKKQIMGLLAMGLVLFSGACGAGPAVKVYLDKESSGWAYKTSDYAFLLEQEGCRIQWNAEEGKDAIRRLSVRRDCKASFAEQVSLHRAILAEIAKRWPLASFKTMAWGLLCEDKDKTLCKPIIRESLLSADYRDYCKHYPHSKLKGINGLFVQWANATRAYAPLADLLGEFGANVRLISVEKVFEAPLGKTPFADEFKALAPGKSLKTRVMVDAGSWYFSIQATGQ